MMTRTREIMVLCTRETSPHRGGHKNRGSVGWGKMVLRGSCASSHFPSFTRDWRRLELGDEALRTLEQEIIDSPDGAPVIEHAGGLRKMRFAPPGLGRGKVVLSGSATPTSHCMGRSLSLWCSGSVNGAMSLAVRLEKSQERSEHSNPNFVGSSSAEFERRVGMKTPNSKSKNRQDRSKQHAAPVKVLPPGQGSWPRSRKRPSCFSRRASKAND